MGLNFKAALVESLLAITGFGVLGTILFWLVAGRYWGKPKFHPYQLGLWWGAWVSAASVMALGRNYYKGFAEVFFSMLLVVPIFFGIGFIAGFVFRKLKPIAGDTSKDYYRIIGVLDDAGNTTPLPYGLSRSPANTHGDGLGIARASFSALKARSRVR